MKKPIIAYVCLVGLLLPMDVSDVPGIFFGTVVSLSGIEGREFVEWKTGPERLRNLRLDESAVVVDPFERPLVGGSCIPGYEPRRLYDPEDLSVAGSEISEWLLWSLARCLRLSMKHNGWLRGVSDVDWTVRIRPSRWGESSNFSVAVALGHADGTKSVPFAVGSCTGASLDNVAFLVDPDATEAVYYAGSFPFYFAHDRGLRIVAAVLDDPTLLGAETLRTSWIGERARRSVEERRRWDALAGREESAW